MKRSVWLIGIGLGLLVLASDARPQFDAETPSAASAAPVVKQTDVTTTLEKAKDAQREAIKVTKDAKNLLLKLTAVSPENPQDELLRKWKESKDDAERGKIKDELHKVLAGQFQAHLLEQEKEIARLEAKVKKLREQLELRRSKQEEIIDFRMQQLLREAQGLGWGAEESTSDRTGAGRLMRIYSTINSAGDISTSTEPIATPGWSTTPAAGSAPATYGPVPIK
jgi:exonuclease VII large subunit